MNSALQREWSEASMGKKDLSRDSFRAEAYTNKLRESWQHLLRDRAARSKLPTIY